MVGLIYIYSMKTLLFILILTVPATSFSSDFRGLKWGVSKSEVKGTEKSKIIEETENQLVYKDTFIIYSVGVVYKFTGDKLIWGLYKFTNTYKDKDNYLKEFSNFDSALTDKYGKSKNLDKWKNENSKFKGNIILAVGAGDLVLWRTWETDTTLIKLTMYGHEETFNIETFYFSKKYKDKASKLIQRMQQDQF